MNDKHQHNPIEGFAGTIFDLWIWITVGFVSVLAFFGRRIINKWDKVIDSHMPDHIIEEKLVDIRNSMEETQRQLTKDQRDSHREVLKEVKNVHSRLDNLYELLMQERRAAKRE